MEKLKGARQFRSFTLAVLRRATGRPIVQARVLLHLAILVALLVVAAFSPAGYLLPSSPIAKKYFLTTEVPSTRFSWYVP